MFGCSGGGSNIITGPKTLCDEIGIPEGKLKSELNIEFCKINDRSLIVVVTNIQPILKKNNYVLMFQRPTEGYAILSTESFNYCCDSYL